jgi:hypothetical protein
MNLAISPKVDALLAQKVESLIDVTRKMPQIKCEEKHHFGPNIYIKEVTMPAGSVIIGKSHKIEHVCNMMSGRMIIIQEDGSKVELKAPMTFIGKPGRKVAYIIETVVFQNIYATDETDIEKLENMFVENPALEQGK